MGCKTCGGVSNIKQVQKIVQKVIASEDCEYTQEILDDWMAVLDCVKSNYLSTFFNVKPSKINSYLGIIKSSINYSTNPCYFKINLDAIKLFIDKVKESGKC